MKTLLIAGMSNSMLAQCGTIIETVQKPLIELGMELQAINLLECYIPYYEEGMSPESFTKLAAVIGEEKNIIFIYCVTNNTPGAVMKIFMEYFEDDANKKLLEGKNVFHLAIAKQGGEREAAETVSRMIAQCGGNELVRVLIGRNTLDAIAAGTFPLEALEKYAEDFYRMSRQNRVFIQSSEFFGIKPQAKQGETAFAGSYQNLRSQVENSYENTKQQVQNGYGVSQLVSQENISSNVYAPEPAAFSGQQFADPAARLAGEVQNHRAQKGASEFLAEIPDKGKNRDSVLDLDIFDTKQENDIEELTKLFETKLKPGEMEPMQEMPKITYERPRVNPNVVPAAPMAPEPATGMNPFAPQGQADPYGMGSPMAPPAANPALNPQGYQQQGYSQGMAPSMPQSVPMPAADMGGFSGGTSGMMPQQSVPEASVEPRNKTVKQMTQSLPHYFQPQIAQGTEAVFQFSIFGDEEFYGYIVIKDGDNEYFEGKYETPDITIISNSAIWQEVLRGKLTAQKAFMTGRLKVRGNFMLLNRFDQIYKNM